MTLTTHNLWPTHAEPYGSLADYLHAVRRAVLWQMRRKGSTCFVVRSLGRFEEMFSMIQHGTPTPESGETTIWGLPVFESDAVPAGELWFIPDAPNYPTLQDIRHETGMQVVFK